MNLFLLKLFVLCCGVIKVVILNLADFATAQVDETSGKEVAILFKLSFKLQVYVFLGNQADFFWVNFVDVNSVGLLWIILGGLIMFTRSRFT